MHPSVDGPFSHFRVLAGDNSTAVNIGVQVSFRNQVLSRCRFGVGLPDPMDRGAWQGTVHGAAESDTAKCLTHMVAPFPVFFGNFMVPVSTLLSHPQQRR